MADVKWIKIATDLFDDEKMLLIESMPKGDSIIVIWLKLLCLAGKQNNGGVFMINDYMAYTDDMLATIFKRKKSLVRQALDVFEGFGMIESVNNVITIPKWEKHQSIDQLKTIREQTRKRVAKHRENQKALLVTEDVTECNVTVTEDVTQCNATDKDIDKDIYIEKEIYKEKEQKKPVKHKYGEYNNVLLTDDELDKLKTEYTDWQDRIERLSSYIASTGKSYKSHYATIRNWARKDVEDKKSKTKSRVSKFNNFQGREYDMKTLEQQLIQ